MAWDGAEFERELKAAVDAFDKAEAARLCGELIAHLDRSDDVYEEARAKAILGILRRKRYFDLLQRVADAFLRTGQTACQISRQYAQSMIDQGNLTAAVTTLEALMPRTARDPGENAEARGLLGRVRKQQYVDAGEPTSRRNRRILKQAVAAYHDVYKEDKKHLWHGINAVALLARARRDGVAVEGFPPPEALAAEILATLTARAKKKKRLPAWDLATAAEAAVALGRDAEALDWIGKYVRSKDTDAFELSSTLRQLRELWQLREDAEPGASLLPVLRSQLLKRQGGQVSVKPAAVQDAIQDAGRAAQSKTLQKILGDTGIETLRWYKLGLERSLAVAKIETDTEAVGTGFVVRGKDFHPAFGEELLLLTNAHVVSDDPKVKALRPDEAQVRFEALDNRTCEVAELLWTSSPDDLDATLLRLSEQPAGCKPFPIAPALPVIDDGQPQRVYIIGHPGGRELSISLNDNLLLDWQDPWLHYRAPTEGGSSGSPVFNHDWRLIGLHHAGDLHMRRLNGKKGTYAANEGIWIQSILQRTRSLTR